MPKPATNSTAAPCENTHILFCFVLFLKLLSFVALARTIQAKKRRTKNAGKPRPPRDLLQKKL